MRKQFFSLCILSVLVQFSLSFGQEDMVKLIRSENNLTNGYHCCLREEKKVLIQVKNVAYEKQVYIHHEKSDGSWIDIPASYLSPGNGIYELWVADPADFGDTIQYGNQFVIKYIVLGQTFWDNNNGNNYTLFDSEWLGPGPMLGNNINVLIKRANLYSNGDLDVYIDLRNIAYAKNVTLTYTTNNWSSSATLNAAYRSSYATGYSTYILWPNSYNVERWKVESQLLSNVPIQFYISYTVNGQTFYDNNYGTNYLLTCQSPLEY
jgi:hypothetical protein